MDAWWNALTRSPVGCEPGLDDNRLCVVLLFSNALAALGTDVAGLDTYISGSLTRRRHIALDSSNRSISNSSQALRNCRSKTCPSGLSALVGIIVAEGI